MKREPRPDRELLQSERVPEPHSRPGTLRQIADLSVSEARASGMDGSRTSLRATPGASVTERAAASGATGDSGAWRSELSSDRMSGPASLGMGSGAGLRGVGPELERDARGGAARASASGQGQSVDALASPRYSDNRRPAYPWRARVRGEQGVVLLSVLVNEQGGVREVRIVSSSGSRVLDEAAESAVRAWSFHPGRRGAQTVPSWVQVPIRFRLED